VDKPTIQFARFSPEADWERFNTCAHRSNTEEQYTNKTCCQNETKIGWVCHKIPIKGLNPSHCRNCPVYQKRENLPNDVDYNVAQPINH
jgi:hypothetical protein